MQDRFKETGLQWFIKSEHNDPINNNNSSPTPSAQINSDESDLLQDLLNFEMKEGGKTRKSVIVTGRSGSSNSSGCCSSSFRSKTSRENPPYDFYDSISASSESSANSVFSSSSSQRQLSSFEENKTISSKKTSISATIDVVYPAQTDDQVVKIFSTPKDKTAISGLSEVSGHGCSTNQDGKSEEKCILGSNPTLQTEVFGNESLNSNLTKKIIKSEANDTLSESSQGITSTHESTNALPNQEEPANARNYPQNTLHPRIVVNFCTLCKTKFEECRKFFRHQMIHANVYLHRCLECQKYFRRQSTFVAHKIVHNYEKMGKKKKKNALRTMPNQASCLSQLINEETNSPPKWQTGEIRNIINDSSSLSKSSTFPMPPESTVEEWTQKNAVQNALSNVHSCRLCGRIFSTPEGLMVHKKLHTKKGKYNCQFQNCNRTFTRPVRLADHVRSHLGTTPLFGCSICGKFIRWSQNFKRHYNVSHPGIPYRSDSFRRVDTDNIRKIFKLKSTAFDNFNSSPGVFETTNVSVTRNVVQPNLPDCIKQRLTLNILEYFCCICLQIFSYRIDALGHPCLHSSSEP